MRATVVLLAIMLSSSVFAQRVGVRAGYRTGHAFMNHLHTIIDAYNEQPEVVTPMPDLHFIHGPAATVGFQVQSLGFNLGFMIGNGSAPSMLRDSLNVPQSNDLIFKSAAIRLEFMQFPEPGATFAFSFGFAAEYTPVKLLLNSPLHPNLELDRFNLLALSPSAHLFIGLTENLYLWLNPHYQFYAIRADLLRTYNLMVPSVNIDPATEFAGKFDNIGIITGLMLSFGN